MRDLRHGPAGLKTLLVIEAEIANAITHGLGFVLSLSGFACLVVMARQYGDARHLVGCSVYGGSLVVLYLASTVYHLARSPRSKRLLRTADHAAIFLLIAGTYTPFTLVSLGGFWGWALLLLVWLLALIGIGFKVFGGHRREWISLAVYLITGWICLIAVKPIVQTVPAGAQILLLAGGIAYTTGTLFYMWDRHGRYYHTVWHVFVLLGSAFHYCAVLFYVIPSGRAGV
jgi:hemolysin III